MCRLVIPARSSYTDKVSRNLTPSGIPGRDTSATILHNLVSAIRIWSISFPVTDRPETQSYFYVNNGGVSARVHTIEQFKKYMNQTFQSHYVNTTYEIHTEPGNASNEVFKMLLNDTDMSWDEGNPKKLMTTLQFIEGTLEQETEQDVTDR